MKNTIVTPEIDAYLIKHYEKTRNYDLAEKLGVTDVWIRNRARRLGLKKGKGLGYKINEDSQPHRIVIKNGASTIYKWN
jgi:hypothetical protein